MKCPACEGYGVQKVTEIIRGGSVKFYKIICPSCQGSGTVVTWFGTCEPGYPRPLPEDEFLEQLNDGHDWSYIVGEIIPGELKEENDGSTGIQSCSQYSDSSRGNSRRTKGYQGNIKGEGK